MYTITNGLKGLGMNATHTMSQRLRLLRRATFASLMYARALGDVSWARMLTSISTAARDATTVTSASLFLRDTLIHPENSPVFSDATIDMLHALERTMHAPDDSTAWNRISEETLYLFRRCEEVECGE
jgi:hypothetical protein